MEPSGAAARHAGGGGHDPRGEGGGHRHEAPGTSRTPLRHRLHDLFWRLVAAVATRPPPGIVADAGPGAGGRIRADVCIVTNAAFPGGNAAATITELESLEAAGLSVMIVNCSVKASHWKWGWLAERYLPYRDGTVPAHHVDRVDCGTAVVRGPRMAMTRNVAGLARRMHPGHAIVVVNNVARDGAGRAASDRAARARPPGQVA